MKPDYSALMAEVESLPILVIVTAPRAGSDFFQSLLDGHPEILQLPGQFQFYPFWSSAACKEVLPDLIEEFIWSPAHLPKFKSRYQKDERWDALGEHRDEQFEVSIPKFRRHLRRALHGGPITSRRFFLAVHLAYAMAVGDTDLHRKRLLACHLHEFYWLKSFQADFPVFSAVYCTRDPRSALVSTVENLMTDYQQINVGAFRHWIKWIFREADQVLPFTSAVKTMPLELLHTRSETVLKEFCRDHHLTYDPCLLQSTVLGRQWWGDRRSKRFIKGLEPSRNHRNWTGKLSRTDQLLIEFLLTRRMEAYGYPIEYSNRWWHWILVPLLAWLPMKYEWSLAGADFRAADSIGGGLYTILNSLLNYLGRVRLFLRFFVRRVRRTDCVALHYCGARPPAHPAPGAAIHAEPVAPRPIYT